ncbi:MAG: hypothetical protein ACRDK0_08955 [Solirubrobacteraceae bacterium]
MRTVTPGQTRRPWLRRLAAGRAYCLAVLVVSALLVVALLRLLEGRDEASVDGAADLRGTTPLSVAAPAS